MDHRQSEQIFRVRFGGDDIVVVRNEFGMHAGLFTERDDSFQFIVFIYAKGNRDLIQPVKLQDIIQVVNVADYLDPSVFGAPLRMVVQYAADVITPFRIRLYSVYIPLCSPAVAHQKYMLLIVSLHAEGTQDNP